MEGMILMRNRKMGGENLQDDQNHSDFLFIYL